MAASDKPVAMSADEAQPPISQDLRNNIYSALLAGQGIRNIEAVLDEHLAASGFKDNLKNYITDLFRSGQATTAEEARTMAMARIKEQIRAGQSNGASNGTNGTTNGNGDALDDIDLTFPKNAVRDGTKIVMKELERVCEVNYPDGK